MSRCQLKAHDDMVTELPLENINNAVSCYEVYKPYEVETDNRLLKRIPIRKNEGIKAIVHVSNSPSPLEFDVIDISAMGFGVVSQSHIEHTFHKGERIDLHLVTKENEFNFTCTICHIKSLDTQKIQLGLFRAPASGMTPLSNYQSEKFYIPALISHQHYYNEYVSLKIINILNKHFTFECCDPELLIFPSMPISVFLYNSYQKGDKINAKITWIENPRKNIIRFGAEIEEITDSTKKMIAQYLFHECGWTPSELKTIGFSYKGYCPLLKFRSLYSHEEYIRVLKLRKLAYESANKIDKNCSYEDLASELDRKSRILVAYHHDTLVAAVNIIFPDNQEMILDTEKAFKNGYPIKLPPKKDMIEIARLCITPDYRKTDLLLGIFEHIYRVLITSEREFIISSTDDHMWPLYKTIGFKKVGVSYKHPVLNGLKHDIMILHKSSLLYSEGISPFVWGNFFMKMTDHLIETRVFCPNSYQKFRINLNKRIMDIAEILRVLKSFYKRKSRT